MKNSLMSYLRNLPEAECLVRSCTSLVWDFNFLFSRLQVSSHYSIFLNCKIRHIWGRIMLNNDICQSNNKSNLLNMIETFLGGNNLCTLFSMRANQEYKTALLYAWTRMRHIYCLVSKVKLRPCDQVRCLILCLWGLGLHHGIDGDYHNVSESTSNSMCWSN